MCCLKPNIQLNAPNRLYGSIYIMKDKDDPEKIWKSEIFGRSLNEIVQEGIQAKLSLLPDAAKYKLSQTITKMVNKGSNNLIAIVL